LQVQGVIAEYERAKISERSRRGKLHAARTGRVSVLSGAPYGYRYLSKQEAGGQARYEIVAAEAEVVRQIFAWVARERVSLEEVRRRLAQQGIPSPSGQARWARSSVAYLLNNPAYQGTAGFGKRRLVARQARLRPGRGKPAVPWRPYSVTRQGAQPLFIAVPSLVSRADFAAAAEQLTENRQRYRQGRAGARYLLQGLLVCRHCGYAWHGQQRRPARAGGAGYAYYRCGGHEAAPAVAAPPCSVRPLKGSTLEEAIWQEVCALLKHPHKIAEEYQRRLQNKSGQETPRGIEPLTRVIEKAKRTIGRLIDLYSEGYIDKSELDKRLNPAKERLGRLQVQAQEQAAHQAEQAELRLAMTRLQDFADQIKEGLEKADWTTRREVIRALVKQIEIGDANVHVVYRVAPIPFAKRPSGGDLQDCPKDRSSLAAGSGCWS
jgi:site-specific DNA recombinase